MMVAYDAEQPTSENLNCWCEIRPTKKFSKDVIDSRYGGEGYLVHSSSGTGGQ